MTHHNRRSIRLTGYDYTQEGAYFVTMVAYQRMNLFGKIVDGVMLPNEWGKIVAFEWQETARLRPYVELDAFVVMPNHVHGIIVIAERQPAKVERDVGAQRAAPVPDLSISPQPPNVQPGSLGAIVRGFKGAVTRQINRQREDRTPIWQRNYYEHIIRNEKSLNAIRQYIENNPAKWADDKLYEQV